MYYIPLSHAKVIIHFIQVSSELQNFTRTFSYCAQYACLFLGMCLLHWLIGHFGKWHVIDIFISKDANNSSSSLSVSNSFPLFSSSLLSASLTDLHAQGQYWASRTLPPNNLPPNMAASNLRWSEVPHYCWNCRAVICV